MKIETGEFSWKGLVNVQLGKLYLHKDAVVKTIRFDDFYEDPLLVELQGAVKRGRWVKPTELKEMIDESGRLLTPLNRSN